MSWRSTPTVIGSATQPVNLQVVADTQAPSVHLVLLTPQVDVGATATIQVSATENVGVSSLTLSVDDTDVILDPMGRGNVRMEQPGVFLVEALATDAAGNVGQAMAEILVVDPSDVEAPQVTLTSPVEGTVITSATAIVGTVRDDNLLYYTLSVAPLHSDRFAEFFRGTSVVIDGVLGTFDPSFLANGTYRLRLLAVDAGGNWGTDETVLEVAGNLKLGNFTLSFTDLSIPVSGVPIVVARTYDTLNSGESRELGYGRRLELRDTDLRTSVVKTGWEQDLIFNSFYHNARVYVTTPGGQHEGFTFQPRLAPGLRGRFFGIYQAQFVPDAGVTSTLTVPAVDLRLTADGEYLDWSTGLPYNPASPLFGGTFTLTIKEGIRYEIDGSTGATRRVSDMNGNSLTFTHAGIVSSAGVSIQFERDPQGRITALVDPAGNRVRYAYDPKGDLVSVTDRDGNTTRFVYRSDRPHYLEAVVDPLSRTGIRSEYDDRGRLVRMLDADGKTIQPANQDRVRRGRPARRSCQPSRERHPL